MRMFLVTALLVMSSCSEEPGASAPPAAPTNLAAATLGEGAHLTWTDNSNNEDEFMIMRKTGGGAYAEISREPFNTAQYHDQPLTAGTSYTYMVMAANGAGDAGSNEVTHTH